ncbi:MAG: LysR family transcriptional regulator [Sneathiellales bacterium]|nr:LysR family transcriptional regulator [Sneathiellales bacterium]
MNWSDLRIFLAIAQEGSLRRAAEKLGVTQPTVARRLHQFEQDIGLRLFERDHDGHRLTPEGAGLLPDARVVESAALRVEQRSLELATGKNEIVRVAAGQTSAAVLSHGLHLISGGPTIELFVSDAFSHQESPAPDVFLYHGLPTSVTGVTRRVGSVNVAVYGAQTYSHHRALPLSLSELAILPWLGFTSEQEHYVTMKWLKNTMRDRPPVARLENTDLMAAAAAAGIGVAVLPCFMGDSHQGLVRLSGFIDTLQADYWTLVQQDFSNTPAIRKTITWIVECFRTLEMATVDT